MLMMWVVVLFHLLSRLSTSFIQMHWWHSDLLHCETSRWCNPWKNHAGSSEIVPHHLLGDICSDSYCTNKWCAPDPDSHNVFFAAATNFLTWCRKERLLPTLGNLYIHSSLSMTETLHTHNEKLKSFGEEKGIFCELMKKGVGSWYIWPLAVVFKKLK